MAQLPNSIVVGNTKGGVGKTTITAHLAVCAAAQGREVVGVDLDPQGHLTRELGVAAEEDDEGRSLVAMAMGLTGEPRLARTPRAGIRCLPGGVGTARFVGVARQQHGETGIEDVLLEALWPAAASGALILIDTQGAAASPVVQAAVRVARWALLPTRTDSRSIDGVLQVLGLLGPGTAEAAGVLLFQVNPRATRRLAALRQQLEELLGGQARLLDTTIRHADHAQQEATARGLVAAEYAELCSGSARRGALGLAGDYEALSEELAGIMRERVVV